MKDAMEKMRDRVAFEATLDRTAIRAQIANMLASGVLAIDLAGIAGLGEHNLKAIFADIDAAHATVFVPVIANTNGKKNR